MIASMVNYPLTCHPDDILFAMHTNQQKNFFCSDVMVRGFYPGYIKRYMKEHNIHLIMKDNNLEILQSGTVDYIAMSYYMTNCIGLDQNAQKSEGNLLSGLKNPYLKASEYGWQIDPNGFRYILNEFYNRYNKPIMVVENGLGAKDELIDNQVHDNYRIEYLGQHIEALKEAIKDGVDCLGYMPWSIMDLIALSTGNIEKRYGFIYVDVYNQGEGTYRRIKKDSFYWYKKVIETNGDY